MLEKEEIENAEERRRQTGRQTREGGETETEMEMEMEMAGGMKEDKLRSTPTRFQSNPTGPPAAAMPSCLGLACIN